MVYRGYLRAASKYLMFLVTTMTNDLHVLSHFLNSGVIEMPECRAHVPQSISLVSMTVMNAFVAIGPIIVVPFEEGRERLEALKVGLSALHGFLLFTRSALRLWLEVTSNSISTRLLRHQANLKLDNILCSRSRSKKSLNFRYLYNIT